MKEFSVQPVPADRHAVLDPQLPPWDPSTCDGCSALPIGPLRVRRRFNRWLFKHWPDATKACERHDEAYYYGGTKEERLDADAALVARWAHLKPKRVPHAVCTLAFNMIRALGGPSTKMPGVSWAHGGKRFKYDEKAG